jgi:hypothetical protein
MEDLWIAQAPLQQQQQQQQSDKVLNDSDASAACMGELSEASTTHAVQGRESVVADADVDERPFGHQASNSSLVDRLVQPIDLPMHTHDDYLSNRCVTCPCLFDARACARARTRTHAHTHTHTHKHTHTHTQPLTARHHSYHSFIDMRSPSDSPVQAELFVVSTPSSASLARYTSMSASSPAVSTPGDLRNGSIAFPSESELDSDSIAGGYVEEDEDDGNEDDDEGSEAGVGVSGDVDVGGSRGPSPLPTLPGGAYDSAAEGAFDESFYDDDDAASEISDGGFFGRVAWVFKRTRDDINALLGCGTPAGRGAPIGCSSVARAALSPQCRELSFEDIDEVRFLGSGASGCVFLGMHGGEKVRAVAHPSDPVIFALDRTLACTCTSTSRNTCRAFTRSRSHQRIPTCLVCSCSQSWRH